MPRQFAKKSRLKSPLKKVFRYLPSMYMVPVSEIDSGAGGTDTLEPE